MTRLKFSSHEATAHKAIVVSLDLAGFSDFCNQPEASVAVPRLVKAMFDMLNASLGDRDESDSSGLKSTESGKLVVPHLSKYTGDGAILIWKLPIKEDFPQQFCNSVVASMRGFQRRLTEQLPGWEKDWRVHKLPKRLRIGIASGIVYALRPPHAITSWTDPIDYVGYCINLAVRLQSHCPDLGFLVHRVLHPEIAGMEFCEAIPMKGTQAEPVALFTEDRQRLSKAEFDRKFKHV